ncbi:MAG: hypothetical protein J6S67_14440 [Methanobrevibacter sp.]|nr:hypothetical protein [Methanobrevibacter sp.]
MNHSFSVEVAEKFGIEKAVILENFYFWIRKNKANKKNIHDGRCYTYNTAEAFAELFPYIKERKIAQLLREMENEDNLLISGQFFNYDRTKSYTLTDFALSFFEHSIIQNLDNGTSKKCIIESQDSGDCLNTDINTVINPNIKADIPPAYIQEKIPVIKAEIQPFLVDCFNKINLHNSKKKNIIPIEKDLFYFETGKGRGFVELAKQYDLDELKSAFENYLFVAESDTWKNSFSLNAFYKNVVEYIPSNFDMTRYIDMPKGGLNQLIEERMNADFSNGCTYRISTFVYHKKEWFNMGMPKGKELEALVKHWLSEDEKNGVDYSALNDDYYDYIKGAKND